MEKFTTKVIIPAAGFGKRVGNPESKEMLLDSRGLPLIDWALDICLQYQFTPIVVVRSGKKQLLNHLESWQKQLKIEVLTIESSLEWPDSVLQAQALWAPKNILLLPDTRFAPVKVLKDIESALSSTAQLALAGFRPSSFYEWGTFFIDEQGVFHGCEKPRESTQELLVREVRAWGVLGFSKEIGRELFSQLLMSTQQHLWYKIAALSEAFVFDEFYDLTR